MGKHIYVRRVIDKDKLWANNIVGNAGGNRKADKILD